jgi:hypothetical protein
VDFAAGTNSLFNTLLGGNALVAPNVSNSTAIGNRATVTQSNSLVLGSIFGVNTGQDTKVGIGTTAPQARLHVVDSGDILFGRSLGCLAATVAGIAFAPTIANSCANYALYGGDGNTYVARPTGGTLTFREGATTQVSIRPGGFLNLTTLGTAGTTALCRNTTGDISTCSSSLRYKEDVASFGGGLDVVERLRPIRFTWKASGQPDIGLAAEEVAEVEPLLAFKNGNGEIEGVNYAQLTAVLVNALQQQQSQIEALKALVCEANPKEPPCAK